VFEEGEVDEVSPQRVFTPLAFPMDPFVVAVVAAVAVVVAAVVNPFAVVVLDPKRRLANSILEYSRYF